MVNGQVNEKDYYCTSYKMIFNHIKEAIKKEINLVEVK
jgi:sulfatase maturation enzyme AslB (radical SAM superfamily)